MPSTTLAEFFDMGGGVDSRSNPLAMPVARSVRCINWCPQPGSGLKLRYGYTVPTLTGDTLTGTIHSAYYFEGATATTGTPTLQFILFGIGGTTSGSLYQAVVGNPSNPSTVSLIANTLSDSERFGAFIANNKFHICDGASQLMWDGTTLRPSGIRSPNSTETSSVTVMQSSGTNTGTISPWLSTTLSGYQFYMSYYNPVTGGVGNREPIGARLQIINATAVSTSTTGINGSTLGSGGTGYAPGDTGDILGGIGGTYVVDAVVATGPVINFGIPVRGSGYSLGPVATAATSGGGTLLTLTITSLIPSGHGIGSAVVLSGGSGYQVGDTGTIGAGGATYIVSSVTGTGAVTAYTITNAGTGYSNSVAATSATSGGGTGLTLNITVGMGGGGSGQGTVVVLSDLPDLSSINAEWVKLLGRTADGGEIPYALDDPITGTWVVAGNTATVATLTTASIDFNSELPIRNGLPPATHKACYALGRVYAIDDKKPHLIDYSESAQDLYGSASFVGNPEESWDPTSQIPFPQNEACRGIFEYGNETWVGSYNFVTILTELGNYSPDGIPSPYFRGTWVGGFAGPRAFIKTPYGPFWVTPQKELMTYGPSGPIPVSTEYQAALLAKIPDDKIQFVELSYLRDPTRDIDRIYIIVPQET